MPSPKVASGSPFWVRIAVTNRDVGTITSFGISSTELGGDVCRSTQRVGPGGSYECVVGPVTAATALGAHSIPLEIDYAGTYGERQGDSTNCLIAPQLDFTPSYVGGRYAFAFYFGTCDDDEHAVVTGESGDALVDIGNAAGQALAGPLPVDCSESFDSGFSTTPGTGPQPGDVPVHLFAVTEFASDGSIVGTCERIPVHGVFFSPTRDPLSIDYTAI